VGIYRHQATLSDAVVAAGVIHAPGMPPTGTEWNPASALLTTTLAVLSASLALRRDK
jgi:hypothetical protein